jgi:hypothetical protein
VTAPLYVFDTNSLTVFGNYYPDIFPTFWDQLEELLADGAIVSCREVRKELDRHCNFAHLLAWADAHPDIFASPTTKEMLFVAEIFKVPHFRQLIGQRQQLRGWPVADPFIIARSAGYDACVITEEDLKPNAAKIPNVCDHFGVRHGSVQDFLTELGWRF